MPIVALLSGFVFALAWYQIEMRVGLIAMSGTPIRDTGVAAIVSSSASLRARLAAVASLPSLGLLTVAAIASGYAEVEYLQCANPAQWHRLPGGFDLIGISSFSAQIDEAYELASRYKESGVPVVIGGTHASVLPDDVCARGFVAAIGEAELVWDDIMIDAQAGTLKSRYGELGSLCDITKSPVPAFHLLAADKFRRVPIQTSRGCPHRCEFCAASVMISPRYRQKNIPQVLAEIDRVLSLWKRPFIEFVDDNALVDRAYWKALLSEIAKRKIRWFAECDVSVGSDLELLDLMRASGCREVLIGLESSEAEDMRGVELNNDWKRRSQSLYRQNIANIQSRGIRVIGCFMLGLDGQTKSACGAIYDFIDESGLFDVQITLQTAFPGTPLYTRLAQNGRLRSPQGYKDCTLFDLNIVPQNMSEAEIVDAFRRLMQKVHANEEVARRRKTFNANLKRVSSGGWSS